MADPYAILQNSQVSAPSLMGVYQGAQDRRVYQLLQQREIALEDRKLAREDKLLGIYSRIKVPTKGGDPAPPAGVEGAYAPPVAPPAVPDASIPSGSPLVSSPAPAPLPPVAAPAAAPAVSATAPPQSWLAANQPLISEMMAVSPEDAFKLSESMSKMDDAAVKTAKDRNKVIGSVAMHLMSLRPEARGAELARMAPQLAEAGIDANMLERADLSDQGLQGYIAQAVDVEKIIEMKDKDRKFEADQAYRREQLGINRERLAVSQGALGLARQREGRVAQGGSASGGDSDLSYLMDD